MYNQYFAVSVKVDGNIVREDGADVKLPFDSEYTILLKNLQSRDAKVSVDIDGENVTDGSVVVYANSSAELKGFINSAEFTNSFKFIKKTKKISNFRGDRIADGLIRVEYTFEKARPVYEHINIFSTHYKTLPISQSSPWVSPIMYGNNTTIGATASPSRSLMFDNDMSSIPVSNSVFLSQSVEEDGITVKGSEINERLDVVTMGALEKNSHVIILNLVGHKRYGRPVTKVVTTRQRIICKTCGTSNRSNFKYCTDCGTYLE